MKDTQRHTFPYLVAIVRASHTREDSAHPAIQEADMVEYRADMHPTGDISALQADSEYLRETLQKPVLLTLRDAQEGGGFTGDNEQRETCISALVPYVDAVDIEVRHAYLVPQLLPLLTDHLCVLSAHYFDQTPPDSLLSDVIERGCTAGADVIKIAAHCATAQDALRLLSLPGKYPEISLAIVGMGLFGPAMRMIAPQFGSVLGYAPTGAPVAPGQLSLSALRTAWQWCAHGDNSTQKEHT